MRWCSRKMYQKLGSVWSVLNPNLKSKRFFTDHLLSIRSEWSGCFSRVSHESSVFLFRIRHPFPWFVGSLIRKHPADVAICWVLCLKHESLLILGSYNFWFLNTAITYIYCTCIIYMIHRVDMLLSTFFLIVSSLTCPQFIFKSLLIGLSPLGTSWRWGKTQDEKAFALLLRGCKLGVFFIFGFWSGG